MRSTPVVATVVTALATAGLVAGLGWPIGLPLGLVVALVAGRMVLERWDRAIAGLAGRVRQWRETREPIPADQLDDPLLGDLASALEATGRDFDRQLARTEEAMPWRSEMVESLPTPAVLFGADGYVVAANPPARKLLGIASDGEPITMLAALGSAHLASGIRRARGDGPVELDAEVSGRIVRAVATTIGRQQLVMVTDRTRERQVENLRRNFVVNASHELKTPVTSIQALAEALTVTLERDPERLPALLERLDEEATRLARLAHDLLDLRRLEEQVRVPPSSIDLVSIVRRVVSEEVEAAGERNITIATDLPGTARVAGEQDDVRLVVRNLVANGVQYGHTGGYVWVAVRGDADGVVLEVRDDGIGIPKADLDRIFERFYRVDVARSRETGGTGLGLSLVRNAVNRSGGRIEVDSLLGAGTTFTVRFATADTGDESETPGPGPEQVTASLEARAD